VNTQQLNILETIEKQSTFEVDIHDGWGKLAARQFGGSAARGFAELLQNAIDSYPRGTPFDERMIAIEAFEDRISVTDYGEGLNRDRLVLIVTLGGTDKHGDASKIGRFGVGFFSIFNPALGTRKVTVTTRCEGQPVELVFNVRDPNAPPLIETRMVDLAEKYSTRVEVQFDRPSSVSECVGQAHKSLNYYPCRVSINGKPFSNAWEEARAQNRTMFKEGTVDGFIRRGAFCQYVTLLCKYECIMTIPIQALNEDHQEHHFDLRSHRSLGVPLVPSIEIVLNCNSLNVTISRDGCWVDSDFRRMVRDLTKVLGALLEKQLAVNPDPQLVLANQYILAEKVGETVKSLIKDEPMEQSPSNRLLVQLAEAKVYRINGCRELCSLVDVQRQKTAELPLFFSPSHQNLRWLGGAFKHDFILLPTKCTAGGGAPDFYPLLLEEVFDQVFNLDEDTADPARVREFVEKGWVDPADLTPQCQLVGERELNDAERALLKQIAALLAKKSVMKALKSAVHIQPRSVLPVFFHTDGDKAVLATGLFTPEGAPWSDLPGNLRAAADDKRDFDSCKGRDLLLGLRRDHPMIEQLIASENPYRVYYAIMFLAHELALCQRVLAPYSSFYHMAKERLASEMRRALSKDFAGQYFVSNP
jgi:hypothetical protein